MGMFASTIQSLSQMAIQEAGVTIPQTTDEFLLEDIKTQLDAMTSLTEEEMYVPPESITVKLSNRLNKYLIEAEDISNFMITNGLTNVKEAVGYILEANDLNGQFHNVAIVIDECSILDEMDDLGYVVSDFNLKTPPKGLGLAMVGKQRDFAKLRNIANTKQLMDLLTGRYGLPLVKRNYRAVGLLNGTIHESANSSTEEDVQINPKKDEKVLHEEQPKKKNENSIQEGFLKTAGKLALGAGIGYGLHKLNSKLNHQPNVKTTVSKRFVDNNEVPEWTKSKLGEEVEYDDPHTNHIQWMKDVASGKYDHDEDGL